MSDKKIAVKNNEVGIASIIEARKNLDFENIYYCDACKYNNRDYDTMPCSDCLGTYGFKNYFIPYQPINLRRKQDDH